MPAQYANNAVATLSIAVGAIDTILQLTPGHGAGFPSIGADQWFYITLIDSVLGENEICRVIERDGDSLTVERGVDSTIARAWESGTVIEMRLVAEMLRELQNVIDADDFLRRDGGVVYGTVNWRPADTDSGGFRQRALGDGSHLLDSDTPNAVLHLFPQAVNGNGVVVAYRLQHAFPITTIETTSRDLASGPFGVASHLLDYNNASPGTLRLLAGSGSTSWVRGNFFSVVQRGTGRPTVTPGPGVTILCPANFIVAPRDRYSQISLSALSQSLWVASGDLAEAP